MIAPTAAEQIITTRMLIVQSKMLILGIVEGGPNPDADRVERLTNDVRVARHQYQTAVLAYGSTSAPDFWVMAYSRMIDTANALVARLRAAELPGGERSVASADADVLEGLIARWRRALQSHMAEAVA